MGQCTGPGPKGEAAIFMGRYMLHQNPTSSKNSRVLVLREANPRDHIGLEDLVVSRASPVPWVVSVGGIRAQARAWN